MITFAMNSPRMHGMMLQYDSYRTEVDRFTEVDTQRQQLIVRLVEALESAQNEIRKCQLDLQNETEARRRFQEQAELMDGRFRQMERRPYIVVLIDADADGYTFHDDFLMEESKGGEAAADELLARIRGSLPTGLFERADMDIVVKAFANIDGMAQALVRDGRLSDTRSFRAFVSGFTSRLPFFDFVDVGPGKERADQKIRENLRFHIDSWQCKHVVLGCCHDSGYAAFLGQFVANPAALNRISLLEGSTPCHPEIAKLALNQIGPFDTLFSTPPSRSPKLVTYAKISSGGSSGSSSGGSSPPSPTKSIVLRAAQTGRERFGPILRDANGRRRDRELKNPDPAVLGKLKSLNLCNWKFLRGNCDLESCTRNHNFRDLTDAEGDALWYLARQGRCWKVRRGDDCDDPKCIYGHN
ncbi:hypothetical protein BDY21DRAFT_148102 [Lineolata rhizophorae]|uniref:DUF7923 domain-containing protein n=1 Tax=Lineolata rhizophorae TaxID=578093 RepID=A0A6A6NMR5_9PEZI|nr:hypothetical protein BDY21DRAFT_148102 [Lineolata rhizophorae]